ncbi:integrase family protein [Methylophilaceae bacterium]|nr:integrase family protein [Methylophilaceae bacterium]
MAKLTTKFIQSATCPPDMNRQHYYDEFGLMLRVTRATEAKSFIYSYRFQGSEPHQISLGKYPQLSLAQARLERDRLRAILKSGANPKVTKDLEKAKIVSDQNHTIKSLYALATDERINNPIKPWTPKHAKGMAYAFGLLKELHNIPIAQLTKGKLREALVKITLETGGASGQNCKKLMSIIYGYAENNDIVPSNLVKHFAKDPILRKPRAEDTNKLPFIPLENIGITYYLLKNTKASLAVKSLLMIGSYTALRVGSFIDLKWQDYDETKSVLVIPPEKMKNRRAVNSPLPYQAKQLLAEIKNAQMQFQGNRWNTSMYIFSEDGSNPINSESGRVHLQRTLKKNNLPKAVFHGFRSVAQILWSKQQFVDNAINVQLDHSVIGGSSVIDRYLGEESFMAERVEMVQWLADHIDNEVKIYKASL